MTAEDMMVVDEMDYPTKMGHLGQMKVEADGVIILLRVRHIFGEWELTLH
jgi:hypothetical protein